MPPLHLNQQVELSRVTTARRGTTDAVRNTRSSPLPTGIFASSPRIWTSRLASYLPACILPVGTNPTTQSGPDSPSGASQGGVFSAHRPSGRQSAPARRAASVSSAARFRISMPTRRLMAVHNHTSQPTLARRHSDVVRMSLRQRVRQTGGQIRIPTALDPPRTVASQGVDEPGQPGGRLSRSSHTWLSSRATDPKSHSSLRRQTVHSACF